MTSTSKNGVSIFVVGLKMGYFMICTWCEWRKVWAM